MKEQEDAESSDPEHHISMRISKKGGANQRHLSAASSHMTADKSFRLVAANLAFLRFFKRACYGKLQNIYRLD